MLYSNLGSVFESAVLLSFCRYGAEPPTYRNAMLCTIVMNSSLGPFGKPGPIIVLSK